MIYFFLVLSLIFNCFLIWYIYKSVLRYSDLVSLVEDLQYKIVIFENHLNNIYELPMYYGEPTIEGLIQHSKLLLASFKEFNEDYIDFNAQEELNELQEKTEDKE